MVSSDLTAVAPWSSLFTVAPFKKPIHTQTPWPGPEAAAAAGPNRHIAGPNPLGLCGGLGMIRSLHTRCMVQRVQFGPEDSYEAIAQQAFSTLPTMPTPLPTMPTQVLQLSELTRAVSTAWQDATRPAVHAWLSTSDYSRSTVVTCLLNCAVLELARVSVKAMLRWWRSMPQDGTLRAEHVSRGGQMISTAEKTLQVETGHIRQEAAQLSQELRNACGPVKAEKTVGAQEQQTCNRMTLHVHKEQAEATQFTQAQVYILLAVATVRYVIG